MMDQIVKNYYRELKVGERFVAVYNNKLKGRKTKKKEK